LFSCRLKEPKLSAGSPDRSAANYMSLGQRPRRPDGRKCRADTVTLNGDYSSLILYKTTRPTAAAAAAVSQLMLNRFKVQLASGVRSVRRWRSSPCCQIPSFAGLYMCARRVVTLAFIPTSTLQHIKKCSLELLCSNQCRHHDIISDNS